MEPDQVHAGLHVSLGRIADRVRLQPNLEVGFGDDRTTTAFNFEAAYHFASRWDAWSPYLGGGVGINSVSRDGRSRTNTDVGLNALGGIERGLASGNRVFLESKLGLTDAPNLKMSVGYTFVM